jgi:hypothetical protein
MANYISPYSIGQRKPITIDASDPRAQGYKLNQYKGRVGAEVIVNNVQYKPKTLEPYINYSLTFDTVTLPLLDLALSIEFGSGKFVASRFFNSSIYRSSQSLLSSTDNVTWQSVTLPSMIGARDVQYKDLVYGSSLYATIGQDVWGYVNPKLASSTDAVTWTQRTTPADTMLHPNLRYYDSFILTNAVPPTAAQVFSNTIFSSTDNITWQTHTLPTSTVPNGWNTYPTSLPPSSTISNYGGMTYAAGKIAIIEQYYSGNPRIINSTDKITWSISTSPVMGPTFFIGYYGGKFIGATSSGSFFFFSTDLVTWTLKSFSGSSYPYAGPYLYVNNKHIVPAADTAYLNYILNVSTDLVTWTYSTVPFGSNNIVYGAGGYLMSNSSSIITSTYAYSTDTVTWSIHTFPITVNDSKLSYGNGKFILTHHPTGGDKVIYTSTDGLTWNSNNLNGFFELPNIGTSNQLEFLNSKTFLNAYPTDTIAYSADGVSWSIANGGAPAVTLFDICYGNSKFVSAGTTPDIILSKSISVNSTDGISWNKSYLPTSDLYELISYGNSTYLAIAGTNNRTSLWFYNNHAAKSTDGITWTATTMPASLAWNALASDGNKFVALAYGTGSAFVSTDGVTWSTYAMPSLNSPYYYTSITYGNGMFLATSYNSSVLSASTDGITWTTKSTPSYPYSSDWNNIIFGNGKFVIQNLATNHIWSSSDGSTWYVATADLTSFPLGKGAFGNLRFVIMSDLGNKALYSV